MLALAGAGKRFGGAVALAPTTLAFPAGAVTALIGPSGCGKSTLLRLLIGLIAPDAGTVAVDGAPLDAARLTAWRRRCGYVIQEGGLFPHLTARDNATLLARHLGRERGWIDARVETLRALTRLPADALDRFPAELSGGQRQRVALMRALLMEPEVLLLDEPLGALDPVIRRGLQEELNAIFAALKLTVVLVTHDLAEAAFLADRIVLMMAGRVVQAGTLAELRETPASAAVTEFLAAQRPPVAV